MNRRGRLAPVGALVALLLAASPAAAERLVVLADLNGRYGTSQYDERIDAAVARTIELHPDAVLVAGDMVAGQRAERLSRGELALMWHEFHRRVTEPLRAAGLPVIAVPGNHDASGFPGFETERSVYREQWRGERSGVAPLDAGEFPFFYAAGVGEVLVIALDATVPGRLPDEQHAFLERVLARDGARFRWRLVLAHLPLWPYARGREPEILRDPRLEASLRRHDVSLFVSGHHHAFWAGTSSDGIVHLSDGNLGGGPRTLVGEARARRQSFTVLDLPRAGPIRVTALLAPDFRAEIPLADLPVHIRRPDGDLTRLDLEPASESPRSPLP